jgi:hypothetical protein
LNWQMIEDLIKRAQERGEFDNLSGMGKPLPKDEFEHLPQEMRMAARILKNAGYDDEAMLLQKEMNDIGNAIRRAQGDEKVTLESEYNKRLSNLNRMLSKKGINTNSSVFKQYQTQIDRKFWD